jgi:hypothetical protein
MTRRLIPKGLDLLFSYSGVFFKPFPAVSQGGIGLNA